MFLSIWLDHMGPFKKTKDGNCQIIAVVDFRSKFVTAKAVPDTSAAESVKFLKENVFCVFGSPNRIISDRGSAFISQLFADVMEEWRVTHTTVSAEHPEANGAIEKVNAALAMAIAGQVNLNHDDWDVYLQQAIHSINTSKHATTEISPHEMVFGDVAVLSHEKAFPQVPEEAEALCDKDRRIRRWRRTARNLILIKQEKMKAYADRFRGPDPVFNIGELVLVARRRYGVEWRRNGDRTGRMTVKPLGPMKPYLMSLTPQLNQKLTSVSRSRWPGRPAKGMHYHPYSLHHSMPHETRPP